MGADIDLVEATAWPADRWDALAARSPLGHAFQSHAWGELKRPLGWRLARYVIERSGRPLAAVALQERALARWLPAFLRARAYLYAPRGPVLLEETEAAARTALAALGEIARRRGAAVLTIDPAWMESGPLAGQLGGAGFRPAARDVQISRTAMLVPLLADEREQHRLLRKSTAHLVNRARRAGATTESVDLVAADPSGRDRALEQMWALLSATARREGLHLRDRDYQLVQWRRVGEAGLATIHFAVVEGRRWAGSVLLHCGQTVHQFQAGWADEADLRRVPANHLLQWDVIRWAAGAGFRHYDLGGVDAPDARGLPRDQSHPLWNLWVFKRGFGAEAVEYAPAHDLAANPLVGRAWSLARRLR